MDKYDLIVIGNGSAGDNIARTIGRAGSKVAVIERDRLGGECLTAGCVPSKAPTNLSKKAAVSGMGWDEVVASIQATQLLVRGSDPNGGMRADGIELYRAEAVFEAATKVRVDGKLISAKDVVIATGTGPGIPPITGLAKAKPQTNRQSSRCRAARAAGFIGGGRSARTRPKLRATRTQVTSSKRGPHRGTGCEISRN